MIEKKLDYIVGLVALFAFLLLVVERSTPLVPYLPLIRKLNLIVLGIFAADVLFRFFFSSDKKAHLRHQWFNAIVFVPLIQVVLGGEDSSFSTVIREIVIVVVLISRTRRAQKFMTLLGLKPAQLMVTSFAFAIGIGAVLLMVPIATSSGTRTDLVDALFTATSATCVTGLIVRDTGTYFSTFGQCVILLLIQFGALGIMTFSVLLTLFLRKRMSMQQQVVMQDILDQDTLDDARHLIRFIIKMTLLFEGIGAVALFVVWSRSIEGTVFRAYCALFHSISAFCNAGFSLFSDSLVRFADDASTHVVVGLLIVSGGLGFMVIRDLYQNVRQRLRAHRGQAPRLRVQTRIVVSMSLVLILLGALLIYAIEYRHAFVSHSSRGSVLLALFQSITTRTAGFNTCDIATLSSATFLVMIVLMFIGASPGSTGGGIKTTTLSVLWAIAVSTFRQKDEVNLMRRSIPQETRRKAITLFIFSIMLVLMFATLLLYTEKKPMADLLFETVSAFGTVGLSTGITPTLSTTGKILVILLMFIGRLGPLTLGYAFATRKIRTRYSYPDERVMVG